MPTPLSIQPGNSKIQRQDTPAATVEESNVKRIDIETFGFGAYDVEVGGAARGGLDGVGGGLGFDAVVIGADSHGGEVEAFVVGGVVAVGEVVELEESVSEVR